MNEVRSFKTIGDVLEGMDKHIAEMKPDKIIVILTKEEKKASHTECQIAMFNNVGSIKKILTVLGILGESLLKDVVNSVLNNMEEEDNE